MFPKTRFCVDPKAIINPTSTGANHAASHPGTPLFSNCQPITEAACACTSTCQGAKARYGRGDERHRIAVWLVAVPAIPLRAFGRIFSSTCILLPDCVPADFFWPVAQNVSFRTHWLLLGTCTGRTAQLFCTFRSSGPPIQA